MTESEATKRPWRAWRNSCFWELEGPNGEGIGDLCASGAEDDIDGTKTEEANAALIVTAVNSHDEARELLREAQQVLTHGQTSDNLEAADAKEAVVARIGAFLGRK